MAPWRCSPWTSPCVLTLGPRRSPVARLCPCGCDRECRRPRPTAGPPKRFAAAIGAVLTSTAALAYGLHLATGAEGALVAVLGITVVMVAFPALEALLGLCVGCVLFGQLMRLGVVPEEICLDCADITRRAQARASSRARGAKPRPVRLGLLTRRQDGRLRARSEPGQVRGAVLARCWEGEEMPSRLTGDAVRVSRPCGEDVSVVGTVTAWGCAAGSGPASRGGLRCGPATRGRFRLPAVA